MSIAEAVIEKFNALPPDKQEQVLNYVKSISNQGVLPAKSGKPFAFLDVALKADLKGPRDWSENLDDYLYADRKKTA